MRHPDDVLRAMRDAVLNPDAIGMVAPGAIVELIDELLELRARVRELLGESHE
jgi:hypothetical protein